MNEPQLDAPKPLTELLEPGTTIMVGTGTGPGVSSGQTPGQTPGSSSGMTSGIASRPLTVARVDGDLIRVVVDTTAAFADQARRGEPAHVTLSDNRNNAWASLDTTMALSTDDAEIDELWSPFAAVYFPDGRQSENIGVLHLRVREGMYWSSPAGRIGSAISMIKAALGRPEDGGEHGRTSP